MSLPAAFAFARRVTPRAAAWSRGRLAFTACCAALAACLLPATPVLAQQTYEGQIYIPGPGESHAAPAAAPAAARNDDSASGTITIPGPGEVGARPAAMAAAIRTLPAPAREAAASTVVPVYVAPAPAATRPALPVAAQPRVGSSAVAAVSVANNGNASVAQAASTVPPGQEDSETIHRAALAYLQQQTNGLPGKITVTVAPSFPRGLAACTTLEPFMPTGARLWGETTVGIRCAGERPWTLYLRARVGVVGTYYVAAHEIQPGSMLSPADFIARDGDLTSLPREVITDPSQATGAVALARIGSGTLLRQDLLRSPSAVTIGQMVRVVAVGQGFTISSEGSAMNAAAPGQQVRVRLESGQIVAGVVKDNSTVEIQM